MRAPAHFYECILPTMLVSLLFAIFPLYPSKCGGKRYLNSSKRLQLVTVMQMTIYITLLAVAMIERASGVLSGKYYKGYKVSNVGMSFEFGGSVVYIFAAYLCSFFKTWQIKLVLEKLSHVDAVLLKLDEEFRYARDFLYQTALLASGMGCILLLVNLQRLNIKREGFTELSASVWIVFVGPLLTTNVMNSQFAFAVLAVRNRFEKINRQLRNIEKQQAANCCSEENLSLYVSEMKQHEIVTGATLQKIDKLLRLHDVLCDVSEAINQSYAVQILVSMFVQFGTILFALFYTYWMFAVKPRSSVYWLCWAVIKSGEILHITVACHLASFQAGETMKMVHKLLLADWNHSVKEKLIIFSKQLTHRTLEFTVCGLFPINGALIFSMVGAASTFIVIMIQFQEAASPTTCFVNITERMIADVVSNTRT